FDSQRISDELAGALLVLHPGRMRQRHPDSSSVNQKLYVDSIGVPCGNGDDQRLIDAMNWLLGPAVGGGEILKHGYENYSGGMRRGQMEGTMGTGAGWRKLSHY